MTKVWTILTKVGAAIVKFLHWIYASEVSFLTLAVLCYLFVSKVLGIVFVVWGILLFIVAYKAKQAAKEVVTPVAPVVTPTT
jgi:hypothetical protein